jgi:membrane protein DedA with SNARE-associated domain
MPQRLRAIRWGSHLRDAAFPLFMCLSLVVLEYLWTPLGLPSAESMLAMLQHLFRSYGLYALYGCAFLEGIFLVSLYFPGSMVIFTAILLSDKSMPQLTAILITCWLAFMSAAFINYAIGYYGIYKALHRLGANRLIHQAEGFMQRFGKLAYFLAAFHPNYIAILEVCSGIARARLATTLLQAGVAMAISGPVLVYGSALIINPLMNEGGLNMLFIVFVGGFAAWSLWLVGQGIRQDLTQPLQPQEA